MSRRGVIWLVVGVGAGLALIGTAFGVYGWAGDRFFHGHLYGPGWYWPGFAHGFFPFSLLWLIVAGVVIYSVVSRRRTHAGQGGPGAQTQVTPQWFDEWHRRAHDAATATQWTNAPAGSYAPAPPAESYAPAPPAYPAAPAGYQQGAQPAYPPATQWGYPPTEAAAGTEQTAQTAEQTADAAPAPVETPGAAAQPADVQTEQTAQTAEQTASPRPHDASRRPEQASPDQPLPPGGDEDRPA